MVNKYKEKGVVTVKNKLSMVELTKVAARMSERLSFWAPVAVCWTRGGRAETMADQFVYSIFVGPRLGWRGDSEIGFSSHYVQ